VTTSTLARPRRGSATNSDRSQKPSSARLTQLNANIEQASAATDAKVAIVLMDRMTGNPSKANDPILFDDWCSIMARIGRAQ
jgi:hypothetical protein